MSPVLPDVVFGALLDLRMRDDPTILPVPVDQELEDFLNAESGARGFTAHTGQGSWIIAFHEFPRAKSED